jgi:molecular chaperone GrpE
MTEHQTNGDAREAVEERGLRAKGPTRAELIQKVEELQAQLDEAQAQSDEHMRARQRAAADYANYKRRTDEERDTVARFANALLIGKLLAVLDDFDRALDHVPPDTDDAWVEGVRLVERKLRSVLESEGVTPIEAVGQPFDPNVH